jgi:UDP-N-acetyl-D-mannosaminuronic acid dehydrogenase|tara:strand:+ start:121 stop:1305 length:1185 start_codon:yes stop_codon:yes gene_type:complete
MKFNNKSIDVLIVGGAGHIGLPLGLLFAAKKKKVVLLDKDIKNIKKINNLEMPFMENGGVQLLKKNKNNIFATNNTSLIKFAKIVIICIGTPVKNSKPDLINFFKMFRDIKSELNPKNLLVIRSSIYPGTVKKISNILGKDFKNISYCPERVVQGKSISELPKLPQIISGVSEKSINDSKKLFELICKKIIITSILEAELIKLFSNAWRYINFSISNQFFMICDKFEIDFKSLRKNMIDGYDRNKGIPYAGFAAGPCLYKDTAQLNSFLNNSFSLGKAATKVNQGLTNFIYKKIKNTFKEKLKKKKIGILGVAFKPDIDDIRDSLSIDLYKFLKRKNLKVKISDDYVKMDEIIDKKKLIKESDIIILGVPHSSYKKLKIPKNKYLIDTWGFFEK